MRAKLGQLQEAFTGRFSDHHAFLLQTMLGRIDQASADIAELEAKIDELVAPFQAAVDRLDEITGVGRIAAQVIIAEIGLDMGRFATPAHLASWARYAPGVKESAGKTKGKNTTGHGNPYLARVLGEAAVVAGRTDTFLGERYRRIARRRGTKKAIVAVGRSILVIVWHLLADPQARYHDLGAGLLRHPRQRRARQAQPCPPAPSPGLQGHPRTRRLTGTHRPCLDPAPLRCAGCCRLPAHRGFSDQPLMGSRKSTMSWLTRWGASACTQWLASAIRSTRTSGTQARSGSASSRPR
jgi:Transposase IS116/IS110/IS902 family